MVLTRSCSNPVSLNICVTPRPVLDILDTLGKQFNDHFLEDGNDFLEPIQQQRQARQLIGGGRIEYALLVLIRSHLEFTTTTIMERASSVIRALFYQESEYSSYSWQTEAAIARQIIQDFPNIETVEDFINDDDLLSYHIHKAAYDYCADATNPELRAEDDVGQFPQGQG